MNLALLVLFLLGCLAFFTHAAPEPTSVKGGDDAYRAAGIQQIPVSVIDNYDHLFAEHRQSSNADDIDDYSYHYADDDATSLDSDEAKENDASARLFIRRFMGSNNNLFGNRQQRITIQIFPNGTSSVTTLPATNVVVPINSLATQGTPFAPTGPVAPVSQLAPFSPFRIANVNGNAVANTLNPQRKGAKKNQDIILRIPAEYQYLFNSGQPVMFSSNNGVNKRRVANKKRVNKNRKGVKKNGNQYNVQNQYLKRSRIFMA